MTSGHESSTQDRQRDLLVVALLVLFILGIYIVAVPGRDTALFLLIGDVIARGGYPYRDAWDLKPPGVYLAYSVPALFSHHLLGEWRWVRVFDTLLAIWCAYLTARLTRRLINTRGDSAAWVAAAWYLVLYVSGGVIVLAQAETLANGATLLGLILCWDWREQGRISGKRAALLGGLFGVTLLLKATSAAPLLAALLFAAISRKKNAAEPQSGTLGLITGLGGLAAPLLLVAAWLAHGDALHAYADIQRSFVAPYVGVAKAPFLAALIFFSAAVAGILVRIPLPALFLVLGIQNREVWKSGAKPFLLILAGAGFIAVWVQFRAFPYHWQVMLPAIAVLTAGGTVGPLGLIPGLAQNPKRFLVCALALPLAWQAIAQMPVYLATAGYVAGGLSERDWISQVAPPGGSAGARDAVDCATYLNSNSAPEDHVLVWGFETDLNVIADRRSSTRFYLNPGLVAAFAPERWRTEFVHSLNTAPPRYFVLLSGDNMAWIGAVPPKGTKSTDSITLLRHWPALNAFFDARYLPVAKFGQLSVYRLRGRTTFSTEIQDWKE